MLSYIKHCEQLMQWAAEKSLIILSNEEAQLILDYLEGHDYRLCVKDGRLIREDLDCEDSEPEECTMETLIYSVLTWHREFMEQALQEIKAPSSLEAYWMALCDRDKYMRHGEVLSRVVMSL